MPPRTRAFEPDWMTTDPEPLLAYLQTQNRHLTAQDTIKIACAIAESAATAIEKNRFDEQWIDSLRQMAIAPTRPSDSESSRVLSKVVGLMSCAALFLMFSPERPSLEAVIRTGANDAQPRVRDGASAALGFIGSTDSYALVTLCRNWLTAPTVLELRAILAAVSSETLLADSHVLELGFDVAKACMQAYEEQTQHEHARALEKILAVAPSYLTQADPARGFSMLESWANNATLPIAKIVAANLRKARLSRHFPDEVQQVGLRLQDATDGWDTDE